MTLFHVLKYPLSSPPTPGEIAALPTAIFYGRNGIFPDLDQKKSREILIRCLLEYEEPGDTLPRT